MSFQAMTWAAKQIGLRPQVKFVLMMMANSASSTGVCFVSRKTLIRETGYADEDTITSAQAELCEKGMIYDTGKRIGKTGKVKIYQFHKDACDDDESDEIAGLNGYSTIQTAGQSPANGRLIAEKTGDAYIDGTMNYELGTIAAPHPTVIVRVPRQKFQIPSYEEMETHARKIEMPITEVNKFFNYHDARGWKYRGNVSMKSWKSAMVTWRDNAKKYAVQSKPAAPKLTYIPDANWEAPNEV